MTVPHSQPAIRRAWEQALAQYQALYAAEKSLSAAHPEGDQYVARWSAALDDLIERTPSPDVVALGTKLRLVIDRCDSSVGIYPEFEAALFADIDRLAARDAIPDGAAAAWQAYGHAVEAQVRGEADPTLTPQQRADRALDAHRAWRCWCATMDRELRVVAPIGLVSEEMAA